MKNGHQNFGFQLGELEKVLPDINDCSISTLRSPCTRKNQHGVDFTTPLKDICGFKIENDKKSFVGLKGFKRQRLIRLIKGSSCAISYRSRSVVVATSFKVLPSFVWKQNSNFLASLKHLLMSADYYNEFKLLSNIIFQL